MYTVYNTYFSNLISSDGNTEAFGRFAYGDSCQLVINFLFSRAGPLGLGGLIIKPS